MRLLLVVDTWGLVGGSERYAGAAAEALAARGHEVSVLCARRGEPALAGLPCSVVPAYGERDASRAELAALTARARALQPDALLVLSCASPAAFEALLEVAPVVRFVQDHTLFCPGLNKLHADGKACRRALGVACLERFLVRGGCQGFRRDPHRPHALAALGALRKHLLELRTAARGARLVVASEYMRRELDAAGVSAERVAVVPYFTLSGTAQIAPREPDAATARFLGGSDAPLVFAAARLVLPDKGMDFLLTALGKLRSGWKAVIAGAGPAETWLREKARAEGLDGRVHFAGWQPPGALEHLYASSDVVAFPSVWDEPFGLVGLEAMAHGKPVVAFDVGGVREWLEDGATGLVAAARDADAFADALAALLADRERANRLGAAGRERARRHFAPEHSVERLERELALAAGAGLRGAA